MNADFLVIEALILDYRGAINRPEISRKLLTPKRSFQDEQAREIAMAILINDGNVSHAVEDLRKGHGRGWVMRFATWCDKIRGGAK